MVKKKVGGGKRYKVVANAKAEGAEPKWDGPAPPLHIQKKLTRKVQFLEKVSKNTASLGAKSAGVSKKTGRKKPLPDLSTLGAALDSVAARKAGAAGAGDGKHKPRGTAVGTSKQRQHILAEESARLQQVLKHPLYRQDPIAAITNHLAHTLPPVPAAKPAAEKGQGKGQAKGKGKKKGGKGRSDDAAMDSD
ncbi:hypothetical protein HYH03_008585 [Edaphochlamys debaryana]|uniref:Ribosome biogenesis protein SLX9 n=1 Tax=Edaphochlamys debaryana TaxID=47281 RepID=A0A835Y1X4_9CHLO|nr:hypothetical protein HYH03_008585 [Edaphochlamys debaryana]|eukprot:KAG2493163.1 hypothetical protein HYH03_008585 [Edaphochlamys debaryana]